MKKKPSETFETSSPDETSALGRRLAGDLPPGSVIALVGPLGSGKTVFVKGMATGFGLPAGTVTSPTFTLINEYGGERPFIHVDLYRLERPVEVSELGLEEYFEGAGIVVLEWAERAGFILPERTVSVRIERLSARRRRLTVTYGS